ncbi:RDD family protein [Streptomyces sp. NPDC002530]
MRRFLAVGLDCYLCVVPAGLLIRPYVDGAPVAQAAALLAGPVLALSFLNQVLLTACFGGGAGKLIMDIRVVSLPEVRRPGPGRLALRWLYGLCWLPLRPWHGLRAGARTTQGPYGAPHGPRGLAEHLASDDPLGLRQVRRGDLAAFRRAAALTGRARTG